MAKKGNGFGKLVAFATIAGAVAAGISYFTKYKSFHKELEEDFYDFEDDGNDDISKIDSTMNRNYVSLHADKDEFKVAAADMADAAKDAASAAKNLVKDAASIVNSTAREAASAVADTAKDMLDSAMDRSEDDEEEEDQDEEDEDWEDEETQPHRFFGKLRSHMQEEKELREKLMSETVQLRAQMDDYEDELNDMNDSVSYTNRLLNFILVLLILALLVVLGIVVYWILLQKGII